MPAKLPSQFFFKIRGIPHGKTEDARWDMTPKHPGGGGDVMGGDTDGPGEERGLALC